MAVFIVLTSSCIFVRSRGQIRGNDKGQVFQHAFEEAGADRRCKLPSARPRTRTHNVIASSPTNFLPPFASFCLPDENNNTIPGLNIILAADLPTSTITHPNPNVIARIKWIRPPQLPAAPSESRKCLHHPHPQHQTAAPPPKLLRAERLTFPQPSRPSS